MRHRAQPACLHRLAAFPGWEAAADAHRWRRTCHRCQRLADTSGLLSSNPFFVFTAKQMHEIARRCIIGAPLCVCVCVFSVVLHVRHEETVVAEPFWLPQARSVLMMLSLSPKHD